MAHVSDLIATDIDAYLKQHETKSLLRFITCGSVDDGKSTLIGRLLYESKMLFEDQLAALEADSKKVGTRGGDIDYALLLDGLAAEREQGITIDVAYRFFSTDRRKFIVADTPGHEQYTRNMVTGASTADLAIILIDARKGVFVQTRRHSYLVSLLGHPPRRARHQQDGPRELLEGDFNKIEAEYRRFAKQIGLGNFTPSRSAASAVTTSLRRAKTPWYSGPPLMTLLETVEIDEERIQAQPFRLPVQWVNRPNLDFRGFAGNFLIVGGAIRPGERIRVLPSGRESTVMRIVTSNGDLDQAVANQSITITLADEVDISRGDLLCRTDEPAQAADAFEATVVWMAEQPMLRGRSYFLKIGPKTVTATVSPIRWKINVNTLEQTPGGQTGPQRDRHLRPQVGLCGPVDPYVENRDTGAFILIDRITNNTVCAGMVRRALRRSGSVDWRTIEVNKQAHAAHQVADARAIVWMTGLSGREDDHRQPRSRSGCTANAVAPPPCSTRHRAARALNKRPARSPTRTATRTSAASREVAKLMTDVGLIVHRGLHLAVPQRSAEDARRAFDAGGRVHRGVRGRAAECGRRRDDPKGLYRKRGPDDSSGLTGVDTPTRLPRTPEIRIDTTTMTHEAAAELIVADLRKRGLLDRASSAIDNWEI